MRHAQVTRAPLALFALLIQLAFPAETTAGTLATVDIGEHSAAWQPLTEDQRVMLRIATPDGRVREFSAADGGEALGVEFGDVSDWPDGTYVWEFIVVPPAEVGLLAELRAARLAGDEIEERRLMARLPRPLRESGAFRILAGAGVPSGLVEGEADGPRSIAQPGQRSIGAPDQILGDDLIVSSSACVGFQCENGELFGDPPDTLRLKDSVVRLEFPDTSDSPLFPK